MCIRDRPVMKSVFPWRVRMWRRTLSPRSRPAWADVAGARAEKLARAPLLPHVGDPASAAPDAKHHLSGPGRKLQRVGDRQEPDVHRGLAEAESRRLCHQRLERAQRPPGPWLLRGE